MIGGRIAADVLGEAQTDFAEVLGGNQVALSGKSGGMRQKPLYL